ncbi:alpha/beta hydrolase [Sphingomonas sp. AOB5]|uniref:alpha/beta hydrolase n=1 Tax=Sphingomonas sp. AOB5 TaxID=3034017 RepID=UPI0023F72130|nr:alpha/beta hydrolase [Sphingomonas sp. AOB5]MDF7774771.1 alpha/beta hydrolase [Sphingomonas sp. AOB5]
MAYEIDPEILAVRAVMAAATGPFDIMAMPPAQGRALIDKAAAVLNDGLPEMASVEDHDVGGMRVRVLTPHGCRDGAWLYYLHGGGWFACSVDTHDRMLRMLAEKTGVRVVSPDYRHAPEHPYPAPLDDCAKGFDWALPRFGDRYAFGGDSAGGNMALALAMRLRDAGRPAPQGCALLYGCFSPDEDTLSQRVFGRGGYGLTAERMNWYWSNYLGGNDALEARPLRAPLQGLPPIFLGIAEADTVADDSRLLHARLSEANVPSEIKVWRGAVHGFLQMTRDVALARKAVADTAHAIRRWIGSRHG